MARVLTAARAAVRPGCEAEYLLLLAERRRAAEACGRNFWTFRHRADAAEYLVFTEWDDASDRAVSPEEVALDGRLRQLARYAPDADQLWDEITLR